MTSFERFIADRTLTLVEGVVNGRRTQWIDGERPEGATETGRWKWVA
jgi:hypothetical protein